MYPLILTCYNRPYHVGRTIYQLRKYKPEPMYVFVDRSPDSKGSADWIDNKHVKNIVLKEIDWTHAEYYFHEEHKGIKRALPFAVDYVFEKHDAMMLLEDDCLPGPYFFTYMEACLDKYRENHRIMSVNGYTIPLPLNKINHEWDVYFNHRMGTWGWGTWKEEWKYYRRDVSKAYSEAQSKGVNLSQSGRGINSIIVNSILGRNDAWSPGWVLALYIEDAYCVYPTISHVHNFGFGRSKTNVRSPQKKWNTPIAQKSPERLPDDVIINEDIDRYFRSYYG